MVLYKVGSGICYTRWDGASLKWDLASVRWDLASIKLGGMGQAYVISNEMSRFLLFTVGWDRHLLLRYNLGIGISF